MGDESVDCFDCFAGFGVPSKPPARFSASAADLLAELDFCGVQEALVYHAAMVEEAAQVGNALVLNQTRDHPRLHPTWAILPPQTGELGTVEQFLEAMEAGGVRALRAHPEQHKYLLNGLTFGPLLEEMVARKVPLLVGPEWETLTALLAEFPELRVIVVGHGDWGDDRYFRPLLDRYPGFHVDISSYHQDHGISDLVSWRGSDRLLYGSGYPEYQMGGALMLVARADIPEEDRAAIAGGNLRRLLGEVSL
jgi:predicted TIM-barrel fold metal-dependent hydrolase